MHLDIARIMDLQATFAPIDALSPARRTETNSPELARSDCNTLDYLRPQRGRRFCRELPPTGGSVYSRPGRATSQLAQTAQGRAARLKQISKPWRIPSTRLIYSSQWTACAQAYHQPEASLEDFLAHILGLSRLPSREEQIAAAFDAYITSTRSLAPGKSLSYAWCVHRCCGSAHLTTESFRTSTFQSRGAGWYNIHAQLN